MVHIDFFPSSVRGGKERRKKADQALAHDTITDDYRIFGHDYFDNPSIGVGYGHYSYDGRFAQAAAAMSAHYHLKPNHRVLEVGCAKGYALVEFFKQGMQVDGVDVSEYAVAHGHPEIRHSLQVGDVCSLPFSDQAFDFVFSKEMLPHVPEDRVRDAIRECMRVSKGPVFFEIQCGRTPRELDYMRRWDATHRIFRTPKEWDALLAEVGYTGDVHYKVLISEEDATL